MLGEDDIDLIDQEVEQPEKYNKVYQY